MRGDRVTRDGKDEEEERRVKRRRRAMNARKSRRWRRKRKHCLSEEWRLRRRGERGEEEEIEKWSLLLHESESTFVNNTHRFPSVLARDLWPRGKQWEVYQCQR